MKNRFLILMLFLPLFGFSQEKSDLSLSLSQACEFAVEHNATLRNSDLEVQKSEAQKWQTFATMLPQVSAAFDYQNYCGYEMSFGGMSIPMNPNGTMAITASLSFSGAQIVGTMLGQMAIEMSKVSALQSEQQVVSQITSVYATILVMEQTIDLLNENLENMNKLYELTSNSVKVGVSEQTDADQLSVQVSSMQSSINSTKRSLEMLYNSLTLQLGSEVGQKIILTDSLEQIIDMGKYTELLTQNFDLNNNYNYQLLKMSTDLSKKQISLAVVDYLPSLTGFYQYSGKTYFGEAEGMNMTPPSLVGISLSVPIWSSGVKATKVREAKLSYQISKNTMKSTEDALLVQHKQLLYNLSSAFDNYEIQKENIEVSQRVFQNVSNKFEYGRASSLDITNSSTNLITAQSNYISSILELVNAANELEQLLNVKK